MKINAICAFWVMFILSGALAAQNLKPKDNPKFLQSATYRIDQLIAEFYRSKKLNIPTVTDDATFFATRVPRFDRAHSDNGGSSRIFGNY